MVTKGNPGGCQHLVTYIEKRCSHISLDMKDRNKRNDFMGMLLILSGVDICCLTRRM